MNSTASDATFYDPGMLRALQVNVHDISVDPVL